MKTILPSTMTTKVHQQVFFTNTPAPAVETDVYFLRGILNWKSPEWGKNKKLIENYKKAPSLRHKRGYKLSTRRAWSSRGEQKPTQIKSSSISLLTGKNGISFSELKTREKKKNTKPEKSSKTSILCDHNYRFSCRSPRELARLPSLSLSKTQKPRPVPLRIWAKTQKPRPISLGIWATNPYSVEI